MASITRKPNGSYIIRVYVGNGKTVNKVFHPTQTDEKSAKKEAEVFASIVENEVRSGKFILKDKKPILFGDFLNEYFESIEGKLSPNTIRNYRTMTDSLFLPVFGDYFLSEIGIDQVQSLADRLAQPESRQDSQNKEPLKACTIKRYISILSAIMKEAYKSKYISAPAFDFDAIRFPKSEYKKSGIYTPEELAKMCECLKNEDPMHRALMLTFILTGMRRAEVVALRWQDIDFRQNIIHVRHAAYKTNGQPQSLKDPKSSCGKRDIFFSDGFAEILLQWKNEQNEIKRKKATYIDQDFIFTNDKTGNAINVYYPTKYYDRIIKKYGFRRINLKSFRHTFCSILANNGEHESIIKTLAGHNDIRTTMNYYVDTYKETEKRAVEKIADQINI